MRREIFLSIKSDLLRLHLYWQLLASFAFDERNSPLLYTFGLIVKKRFWVRRFGDRISAAKPPKD